MSLDVPTAVLDAAERGELDDARSSPSCATRCPTPGRCLRRRRRPRRPAGPRSASTRCRRRREAERGQLLRALASNAIRGALERHFGVVLAFQNCHRVAAFAPAAVDSATTASSSRPRGQVLNQTPELRDC